MFSLAWLLYFSISFAEVGEGVSFCVGEGFGVRVVVGVDASSSFGVFDWAGLSIGVVKESDVFSGEQAGRANAKAAILKNALLPILSVIKQPIISHRL
jgi:hypothetical protein